MIGGDAEAEAKKTIRLYRFFFLPKIAFQLSL
jgi:hypothetical protein